MTLPDYIAHLIIEGTEKKFSEMHEDWLEEGEDEGLRYIDEGN